MNFTARNKSAAGHSFPSIWRSRVVARGTRRRMGTPGAGPRLQTTSNSIVSFRTRLNSSWRSFRITVDVTRRVGCSLYLGKSVNWAKELEFHEAGNGHYISTRLAKFPCWVRLLNVLTSMWMDGYFHRNNLVFDTEIFLRILLWDWIPYDVNICVIY